VCECECVCVSVCEKVNLDAVVSFDARMQICYQHLFCSPDESKLFYQSFEGLRSRIWDFGFRVSGLGLGVEVRC
jgi:hypothetical protein